MPKIRKKTDQGGPKQLNLFDYRQVEEVAERVRALDAPPTEGTANIAECLRIAIKKALRNCQNGLSRAQVAGEMSHLLGNVEVTKYMLDTWTAESKEGHRIPAEYIPALCLVTGNREPLRVMAEASGWFAMPGQDALRSEMQKLDEETKRLAAKKRELSVLLKTTGGE